MIKPEDVIIVLDNGHGSDTKGKCSPDRSILEYAWCREMVKMISDELKTIGFDVRILVPEEKDIPLKTRVDRVNKIYTENGSNKKGKFVFLVSVHINAAGNGGWHDATGWTTWIAKSASDKSKLLAKTIYDEAAAMGLKGNRCVPKEHYWLADYYILKNSKCPATLTENMFQDNKEDVKFLLSAEGKEKLAHVHVEGIRKYINQLFA